MTDPQKSVFISYRRDVAAFIARAIFMDLREHGWDVFMDVERIDSGEFNQIILNQIAARGHFIVILTLGTLERCADPDDWLRKEVEFAIDLGRNIVPITIEPFKFTDHEQYLTGKLAKLSRYNAVPLYHVYFEAGMDMLRNRFLMRRVEGTVQPTPSVDQPVVERKIEEAASHPPPTKEELSAEEWFSRGVSLSDNSDEEIHCYTEAIHLKHDYAEAYYNRGVARRERGDINGAIEDYNIAIHLKPDDTRTYNNRGIAHANQGNYRMAIEDFTYVIRLKPDYAKAYYNRGNVRRQMGDFSGAIADYDTAIHLNPDYAEAHNNRGFVLYSQGRLDVALADVDECLRLDPHNGNAWDTRGQVNFASGHYQQALGDFSQVNALRPGYKFALTGLAITHHALGNVQEALRIWRESLLPLDERYRDAEWVGKELNWRPELIEEARRLIAKL